MAPITGPKKRAIARAATRKLEITPADRILIHYYYPVYGRYGAYYRPEEEGHSQSCNEEIGENTRRQNPDPCCFAHQGRLVLGAEELLFVRFHKSGYWSDKKGDNAHRLDAHALHAAQNAVCELVYYHSHK